ncbi:PAK- GC kinase Sid1 [Coccidioides posadasii str. Silveira]|uniref:L-ornithine N(5)-monooxygenase n=1 Tax=Coccidioides posadasii (strain C735) TaxID=222929 RepID=C5PGI0_COCP7|nr:L-ornithine 5-monooxygenase, putative [Coccidioides posadasii C735 delta SOWgp]EER23633.1 L-ornithine 5-monooxygenase, putative [Coccidioides posadasii C735 delta SOWgp]QVM07058.1 PAK- GC kinase Sid1 [Coccidioides posadasii str. Silveira]|eukprot:XP_003065778.1 L-ornithine 5-monooxygenase, putative [Coccidioides posadasii C735 delta SOWgp]
METTLKTNTPIRHSPSPSHEGGSMSTGSGSSEPYDIISVGFGASALAIAIAMRDRGVQAKVLFLERQSEFGWHTGMLLPGTKMQISFLKDLATLRNPRSHFTFLNYLHTKGRLVHFTNLSTHTPFREEFNDYMKWCASHFADWVQYDQEVMSVTAVNSQPGWPAELFRIVVGDRRSGEVRELYTKHVVVATGGEPAVPQFLPQECLYNTVIHSSGYLNSITELLKHEAAEYRVAVVGGGQSAAEICEDLSSRYPRSKISLIARGASLRPSDDSPFVNEIFDPESVDTFYSLSSSQRKQQLQENKATNYSVIRLPLLETLYEKLYRQKLQNPDQSTWPFRLITNRELCGVKQVISDAGRSQVELQFKNTMTGQSETLDKYDLVILATGYKRNPFTTVLKQLEPILETGPAGEQFCVDRKYRLAFLPGKVRRDAGIWLQGCCESTHGLSDSLLSILSVRSSELLDAILSSSKRSEQFAKL